ncbi:MAG: hypothetical protein EOP53_16020 [Sphingobacteriales bacterium]|nr:MAG: hypothetical protein EOP53_16020 [Sphingobacteriales bacterium]
MNTYLHNVIFYIENVIHPAGGQPEIQKTKPKSSKKGFSTQVSPESLNIRATVKAQNGVRRNPAP